ncbi:MAG TPA: YdcF family protein [Bacillus bacterium]|nr:YdcF family protein [Bacillus sp. (in: firmicutes)]
MIVMEDQSTSTQENFEFTKQLMLIKHPKVIVVTSDFHLYCAKYYANKAGFEPYSAGASTPLSIVPLTHSRETLAVGFMSVRD